MPHIFSSFPEARHVSAQTLTPQQRPTSKELETAVDFRQQRMLKHPFLSDFHSLAEYLHAGLLEGDPTVTSFVPQPFLLRINGKYYTPDCYFIRKGKQFVVELKPDGKFPDAKKIPLEQFLPQHGMTFLVVSNESILKQQLRATNWLEIVRILYSARMLDTESAEREVLQKINNNSSCQLDSIVDPGDRERTYTHEIALLRLLHRGLIRADLDTQTLDYLTEFYLCTNDGDNDYNMSPL